MDADHRMTEMQALRRPDDDHKDAETNEHELSTLNSIVTNPKVRVHKPSALRAWIWECGAIVLVLAMLGTMIGILFAAQGQSAAAWRRQHYNVSVNAVVAVLTGLVKGGCMFVVAQVIGQTKWHWFESSHRLGDFGRIDDASRGPWGSVQLLGRLRAPTLARIGALLTVVALAVDPFTQNTIATSDCQILESNQTAHIPIAREYHDPGSFRAQLTNFTDGDFILWGDDTRQEASTAIKASVYAGLYGSATTVANGSSVYIPCTGNSCKFPFYSTLAICHKCADASSHVKRACTTGSAGQGNVFQSPCTYSLPNGQSIGSQPLKDDLIRQYNRSMAEYIPTWALANALPSAVTLPNIPGTFTNLSILANVTTKPTCLIGGLSSESICDTLNVSAFGTIYQFNTVAVECSLFPCVRSYSASTVNGNVVETELNRTVGEGDWLISTPSYPVLMPVPFVWLSPDKNCNQSLGGADGPPDCKFRVDTNALRGLGNFFWRFWNGTVSGKDYTHATIDNNIFGALYNRGYTNLTMIDRIIGGIADSMTAVVRKSYAVNILYPDIHGQVFLSDQCIEIRWAWLSLPAIVACATVIMLICTILISITHRDQPIWKSSTLPILFHGLGAADRTEISHSMSLAEMEKKANRVWTKTSGKGDGSDLLTLRSDQG